MANNLNSFPIDFDLYNENEEQVLFITDDIAGQELTLEVVNSSDKAILINADNDDISVSNHHFELVFRPNTVYNNPPAIKIAGNQFDFFMNTDAQGIIQPNADGTISLYFKSKTNLVLQEGEKLLIKLTAIRAAATDGTRGTRVMLKYRNMLHQGETDAFTGFREMHLNIVNHTGRKNIPLHVGFVGSNMVLNDGIHPNTLKFRITNSSRKDIPIEATADSRIVVVMEGGAIAEEWTLATNDQLDNAVIKYKGPGQENFSEVPGTTTWQFSFVSLNRNSFIDVEISNLVTNHLTGHANLYVHYENIPGYWDGQFVLQIEKSPIVFSDKNVGVGTASPGAKLNIAEFSGTTHGPSQGTLMLDHENAGGASSIVFRSKTNRGSDYGFIQYQDAVTPGAQGESSVLTIGTNNDADDHLALMPSGNVGVGITTPQGKLNVSEPTGTVHGPGQGTLILDHENAGGASSIVFRSKINRGSDYGFIQYQDAVTVGSPGESSVLSIGTNNDADDHVALVPSGNVGVGTTSPRSKLTIVPGQGRAGLEVNNPNGGDTHVPWTDNWNYISGNGAILRNPSNVEKLRFDANSGNLSIGSSETPARLQVKTENNGRGVEIISPTAGNTHFPWTDNWNYISGNGVIFRNPAMTETARLDTNSGTVKCKAIQIGNTVIGEGELAILKKLAAGDLQVDLWNVYQQEYMYAADYAPFDNDRRRVFTWRPKDRINQGQWKLRFPG